MNNWKLSTEKGRTPLIDEAKKVKRGNDRNQGKRRVTGQAFTQWRVLVLRQSLFPHVYTFPFTTGTFFLPDQKVPKPASFVIQLVV